MSSFFLTNRGFQRVDPGKCLHFSLLSRLISFAHHLDLYLFSFQAILAFSSAKTRLLEDAQTQRLQTEVEELKEQIRLKDAALAKQNTELAEAKHITEEQRKDIVALQKVLDDKRSSD